MDMDLSDSLFKTMIATTCHLMEPGSEFTWLSGIVSRKVNCIIRTAGCNKTRQNGTNTFGILFYHRDHYCVLPGAAFNTQKINSAGHIFQVKLLYPSGWGCCFFRLHPVYDPSAYIAKPDGFDLPCPVAPYQVELVSGRVGICPDELVLFRRSDGSDLLNGKRLGKCTFTFA